MEYPQIDLHICNEDIPNIMEYPQISWNIPNIMCDYPEYPKI